MKKLITLFCIGLVLVMGTSLVQANSNPEHRLLEQRVSDKHWPGVKQWLIESGYGDETLIYRSGMVFLPYFDAKEKDLLSLVPAAMQVDVVYGEGTMRLNGFVDENGELFEDMTYENYRKIIREFGYYALVLTAAEEAQLAMDQLTAQLTALQTKVAAELATTNAATQKSETAIENLAKNTLVLTTQANVTSGTVSGLKQQLQSTWDEVAAGKEITAGHTLMLEGLSFSINDLSKSISDTEQKIADLGDTMQEENKKTNQRITEVNDILNGKISNVEKGLNRHVETTNNTFWYTWISAGIAFALFVIGLIVLGNRKIKSSVKPVEERLAALDAKVTNVTKVVVKTAASVKEITREVRNHDFDESLITAAKLDVLSGSKSIELTLTSRDNGEVKKLLIEVKTDQKTGKKQVLVYGALSRVGSDHTLTLDSTENVASCIRRASNGDRIIGLVDQKLAKAG